MTGQLKRTIQRVLGKKQNQIDCQVATVGNTSGIVDVPGRSGYIYVQINGVVVVVRNTQVAPVAGTLVLVGKDTLQPNLLQVLSTYSGTPRHSGTEELPSGGFTPASRYEWMHPDGGEDPIYIQLRQIMPLRVGPSSGMVVKVYRGYMMSGALVASTTVDLTAHVPAVAGKARWVLIYVDTSAAVQVSAGTIVDLASLAYTDIPAPPAAAALSLAAVRLYNGQTAIAEARSQNDILDLRWPMWHQHGDGTLNRLAAWDTGTGALKDSAIADGIGGGVATLEAALTANRTYTLPDNSGEIMVAGSPIGAHAASHQAGGGDAIKLDDLGQPDDNTDLDASATRHGLLPKLSNKRYNSLRGDGTWEDWDYLSALLMPLQFPQLRAYWTCGARNYDYNILDISGNSGTTLMRTGGSIGFGALSPGIPYAQVNAGGVSSYYSIADNASIDITESLTMGGWIRSRAVTTTERVMGKWNATGNQRGYLIMHTTNGYPIALISQDGAGTTLSVTSTVALTNNVWAFVVMSFIPGTSLRIRVNDTVTTTTTTATAIFNGTSDFAVGSDGGGLDPMYGGLFSNVFLCSGNMSDDILRRYYDRTKHLYGITS